MKQRLADSFPVVVAAVLPIAGLILAVARFSEGNRPEATRLGLAAALGALVYVIAFTA